MTMSESKEIMFSRKLCLVMTVAVASVTKTTAFSSPIKQQLAQPKTQLPLPTFLSSHETRKTALHAWPGKTNKKESEGKREADSSLNLSGDVSEASLFFGVSSTKDLEELVAPVSKVLDDQTGGWALSYANLEPEDETTPIGISFLATNIAYGLAGSLLMVNGNVILGVLTELACIASFFYHYSQLKFGQRGSQIVRLTLLVDYFFALSAILVGSVQLLLSHQLPMEAVYSGVLAVGTLGACWIWEEGLVYIFFHSLWHLFSALTGYIIGSIQ